VFFVAVRGADSRPRWNRIHHEYAHALLHFDVDETERSKREVEAEAVAYVVERYCGLDTSESAFYLAAWGRMILRSFEIVSDGLVGRQKRSSRFSRTDPRPNQLTNERAVLFGYVG